MALTRGSQSLFATRTLRNYGLSEGAFFCICSALLIFRLTYALPAWFGFASAADRQRLQSVLNKASRWGLTGGRQLPSLAKLSDRVDITLFHSVISNPSHVLHQFRPPSFSFPRPASPPSYFFSAQDFHPPLPQLPPQNAVKRHILK